MADKKNPSNKSQTMDQKNSKKMLPVGFYDLLFEEAEKNHNNINHVLSNFMKAGYRLIKTPLVEFEENLLRKEIKNSFRTIDIISGKNLVFRNDITLQISRLIATRLSSKELPLKLCYVGDVICANCDELYLDRQQTQVGLEIIGCDQNKSSFEIISNLLVALEKLNLKDLVITISLPDFLQLFLNETQLSCVEGLKKAITEKNISLIKKLAKNHSQVITKITLNDGSYEELRTVILQEIKNPKIIEELDKAFSIASFISKNFTSIECNFDLFGDDNSGYHHEIYFDVFCKNFAYSIARGGRYKIISNNKHIDAVGATIYMNHLRKL